MPLPMSVLNITSMILSRLKAAKSIAVSERNFLFCFGLKYNVKINVKTAELHDLPSFFINHNIPFLPSPTSTYTSSHHFNAG